MLSAEIRQSFLNFFAGQDHKVLPSSSLIPHEDTSVLLTTAGMQQFKPLFMGLAPPPAARVTTVQKCFRTKDLDEVGDLTHLTFFEMLGNFSFGDYFKKEAIEFSWEYLTRELDLDPTRLWPTIHPDDGDSELIWPKVSGKKPYKLTDNFWAAGPTGPCGPDSETYFDWGPSVGCGQPDCYPGHCDRYLELWNLVFLQYDRRPDGEQQPLAMPGVDTGMGLERLAAVLAGGHDGRQVSIYETDIFDRLRRHFESAGAAGSGDGGRAARLLADHARGTSMLIADGVRPGNEGRGYVLRRMIRRATLQGHRVLGIERPLSGAVALVVELMGDAYPELGQNQQLIVAILESEESAFERTLESAQAAFADIAARSTGIISGEDAFRLYDTFGLPIDLTVELAAEAGLQVDRIGFDENLAKARQRSRRGAKQHVIQRTGLPPTNFLGYETMAASAEVISLFRGAEQVRSATEGQDVEVYLDRTPMYAEAGGQVGDIGIIEGPAGAVEVRDVQRHGEAFAHYGVVASGQIGVGDKVQAEVDEETRWSTMRHHSATHLLHRALGMVLGEGARQAGSYVGPETCTFDFGLPRAPSREELEAVFRIVNHAVREDLPRTTRVMPLKEARQSGAMMLFGEKYSDVVRVVSFGDFSAELCGGTHVERTGQIGAVVNVAEKSVGAGLRRIEFLAGEKADGYLRDLQAAAEGAAAALHVGVAELPPRVEALLAERKQLQKRLEELERMIELRGAGATTTWAQGDSPVRDGVAFRVIGGDDPDLMRHVADDLLDSATAAHAAVVLARSGDEGRLVVKTRRGANLSAADAFGKIREMFGGKGGGSDTLAQGGGFRVEDFDAIVAEARAWVREHSSDNGRP